MSRPNGVLAECAQHYRGSSYEYEQLLGATVERLWLALGNHVERQLQMKKGVNISPFGKVGFLRSDLHPNTPVFLLADRFINAYNVAWQRPPPAPITPTVDINMSIIANELSVSKDQAVRALEALLAFIGGKLQKGIASGRLRVGNVGSLCFQGRSLSFVFDDKFVQTLMRIDRKAAAFSTGTDAASTALRNNGTKHTNTRMQRSFSADIPPTTTTDTTVVALDFITTLGSKSENVNRNTSHHQATAETVTQNAKRDTKKRHHHHHKSQSDLHTAVHSPLNYQLSHSNSSNKSDLQILPRFLLPVQAESSHQRAAGSKYDLVMQDALSRENARKQHLAQLSDQEDRIITLRQQATQLRKLEEQAERNVGRRELNAFLNGQIRENAIIKQQKKTENAVICDYDAIRILPREKVISEAAQLENKKNLSRRLNDQVAFKEAQKRDKLIVEQSEAAYFISSLNMQAERDRQQELDRKRIEKETLLADWKLQQVQRQH